MTSVTVNKIKCSREEQNPVWYNLLWCGVLCAGQLLSPLEHCGGGGLALSFLLNPRLLPNTPIPPYWQLLKWNSVCVCVCVQSSCVEEQRTLCSEFTSGLGSHFTHIGSVGSDLESPQTRGQLNGPLWHKSMTTLACSLSSSCYYEKLGVRMCKIAITNQVHF